jgi:hypothetical protein
MKRIDDLIRRSNNEQRFKIIRGNICKDELPKEMQKIVIANIDVDMYDATRDAIRKVAERMVRGGIIIAEDPASTPQLIGAFYAMEAFLKTQVGKKFMKIHVTGQYFLIKMNE